MIVSLGLDISTKTGAVVLAGNAPFILYEGEWSSREKGLDRCSEIAGQMLEVMNEYAPDIVVIEGYGFANKHTLVTLVEVGTILRYFLRQSDQKYVLVAPNALKKFVTNKGNSKKEEMLFWVYKRWGFEAKSNNTADAFGLARIGLALKGPVDAKHLTKPMKEVLKKIDLSCN